MRGFEAIGLYQISPEPIALPLRLEGTAHRIVELLTSSDTYCTVAPSLNSYTIGAIRSFGLIET